jgi:Arc/MetJ family transcription regulator
MARIYYSATRGFFHEALHTALPEDAVRIAALRHAELMGAQSEGRQIIADARGRPVLAPVRVPGLEELRAQAIRALDAEAERRILGLASLARQSNDNALIAQAALAQASGKPAPEGLAEALARRAHRRPARHRHPHRRADRTMPAANLTGFDPLPRACGEG